ncbi:hypothetical protein DRH13_06795 [Candidatus Woesebacteria bacterium]|nr:MAG: hypothetical protein DRH13_06795 [Candidatus Woesebacteria bacterium]
MGVSTMATWEYNVTSHIIKELSKCEATPEARKLFSCDDEGKCMVNDVCKIGTEALASLLNEHGKEGWELILTNYHHGELLCIWKRAKEV